jgi:hypothetical protein
MRRIDLGPCPGDLYEGDPERLVVLLPGAHYRVGSPLFWFAREAALERGWSVLAVGDELGEEDDRLAWARDRAERALDVVPARRVVVIGKSIASTAAGLIAERELPAVWLTPLVAYAGVVEGFSVVTEGLASTTRPALLVGSTDDPSWNRAAVPDNPLLQVLELNGLDHSLEAPGDALASLDALSKITEGISAFLDSLGK